LSNIKYAVYYGDTQEGGVYNVLASFMRGVLKGFKEAGIEAYTYEECIQNKIDFDVALGFNVAGCNYWAETLKSGKFNLVWNVDTIFGQNFDVFRQFQNFENFILLSVSSSDFQAAFKYVPNLKMCYMPHATDKDLWIEENTEKTNDIVFFSSLYNWEAELEKYKNNKTLFGIVNEMVDMMLKQPNLTFWDIYNQIQTACKFELSTNDYAKLNKLVCFIVEQKQKIKMIEELSDFNVKIFGNDFWRKYTKGNIEYKGSADLKDSIKIMNQSKISLNCQASVLNHGFHERMLNAASVATFNLVSATPFIQEEFKETFGYFNHITFEDIKEKAEFYLKNDNERTEKAHQAQKIVHENHLWKNRAIKINELFVQ